MSRWQQAERWFNNKSVKDRWLLASVALLVVLWLLFLLGVDSQWQRGQKLQRSVLQQQTQLQNLQTQQTDLQTQIANVQHSPLHQDLAQLTANSQQVQQQLLVLQSQFIDQQRATEVLQQVLAAVPGVKVEHFKLLPSDEIQLPQQLQAAFYHHRFELALSGKFAALQQYVANLTAQEQGLRIAKLDYQVMAYPKATMVLTLTTVSQHESFVGF